MSFEADSLGKFVNFSNGKTSPERSEEYKIPVFGSNGLIGFTETSNSPAFTSVIGRVGSYCGSILFSKESCWVTDNAIKATSKLPEESRFWYYAMLNRNLHDLRAGSGQPLINQTSLKAVLLPVPTSSDRLEIAAILGALDDKIELNRKTAATLEAMARALYRSWFVDFDPVHARANGQAPTHMPPTTATLFPDSFNEDGLPEGWEMGTISSLGDVVTGKTPSTKDPENFGDYCPFVKIPDMHGKMFVTKPSTYLSEKGVSTQKRQILKAGSVSVSCIATLGLVTINPNQAQTNQQINSVVPCEDFSTEFVYWTCFEAAKEVLLGGSGGSVFGNVNKSTFAAIPIQLATPSIRQAFTWEVADWHNKVLQIENENQSLATLRDTLLPRLMSGELRVGDAQKQVEPHI